MITQGIIEENSNIPGRKNRFDDRLESKIFKQFLDKKVFKGKYLVIEKPFGQKGVDLGVFNKNVKISKSNAEICFDFERSGKTWIDDWPDRWKCLSFMAHRKDKYIGAFKNFGMVWFNKNLTKFVISWENQIIKYPITKRYTKSKITGEISIEDVRQLKFDDGVLYGSSFSEHEKKIFKNIVYYKIK